jgi:hypothetical protein
MSLPPERIYRPGEARRFDTTPRLPAALRLGTFVMRNPA